MNLSDLARRAADLAPGETVLLPWRDLRQVQWQSTDELERELRSILGGTDWAFRSTEDGMWVTRREP